MHILPFNYWLRVSYSYYKKNYAKCSLVFDCLIFKRGPGMNLRRNNRMGHMILPELLCRVHLLSFPSVPASRLADCQESMNDWAKNVMRITWVSVIRP